MKTFDITLEGFDGTTQTDHLVWWFKAPSQAAVDKFLAANPVALHEPPRYLVGRDEQIAAEEVDMILDENGSIVAKRTKQEWPNLKLHRT